MHRYDINYLFNKQCNGILISKIYFFITKIFIKIMIINLSEIDA